MINYKKYNVITRLVCMVFASALLYACSDSGGGSESSEPTMTVSSTSLSFSGEYGGATPAQQSVTVDLQNATSDPGAIYVLVSSNNPQNSPIEDATYDLSTRPVPVVFSPKAPADLGVGEHLEVIQISLCKDASCNTHFSGSPKSININYTVAAAFNISTSALNFSQILGHSDLPTAQAVDIFAEGIDWSVSSNQTWLQLDVSSGSGNASVNVSVDASALQGGVHAGQLTFTNMLDNTTEIVDVTHTISLPTITASLNTVALGGTDGLNFDPQNLDVSINTGTNAYAWNASTASNASWLSLNKTTGSMSSTTDTIELDADRSSMSGGIYNETLTVTANVNGTDISTDIAVALNLSSHDLLVDDNGVALASMPSLSKLTHTVKLRDTYKLTTTPWTASSDQTWLSVTTNGAVGDNIVLAADPASLAAETIHYATVSFTSTDSSVEQLDTIKVGFWVSASDPNASDSLAVTFTEGVTDPVRPYLYVHNGGTDISVYNIYTAALETTITNVAAQLGDMVVSEDGAQLFVMDNANFDVVPVNLDSRTVGAAWGIGASARTFIEYARTDGKEAILASDGLVYDANTGILLSGNFEVNRVMDVSLDGTKLCALNLGLSPYTVTCYDLSYSTLSSGIFNVDLIGNGNYSSGVGSNGRDVAVNADGSRFYVASGAPYVFLGYNGTSLEHEQTLAADAYPNSIEIGPNGNVFGGVSSLYGPTDTWVYNQSGTELGNYYLSGYAKNIAHRQLLVSGDGLRIMSITTDPALLFTSAP